MNVHSKIETDSKIQKKKKDTENKLMVTRGEREGEG